MNMDKEQTIRLIRGRIMDEYHKHPNLDWADIAARKLQSQWSEYFEKSISPTNSICKCKDRIGETKLWCCNICGLRTEDV